MNRRSPQLEADVFVVGGGAAGIVAAMRARECGAKVTILEKTVRIGTKILMSGGGKCNICHAGTVDEILRAFRKNEREFLRPCFYRYTNEQVLDLFTSRGLEVYTRPDGRIFPKLQTAKDVVLILESILQERGVEIVFETPVTDLIAESGRITGFRLEGESEPRSCSRLIVSTGGASYPKSGTTGDAWPWLKVLGHTIIPIRAALAPIYTMEPWVSEVSGVALRDVVLKARHDAGEFDRWTGDLLFTHHGISGPCALAVSRAVVENIQSAPVLLFVDVCPNDQPEELVDQWQTLGESNRKLSCASLVEGIVPQALVSHVVSAAQVDGTRAVSQTSKKDLFRLANALKAWQIGTVKSVPIEKGEVVAGGVALDEVDPRTMRSRKIEGLWICGEALDIAGPVGGYNLQAAWSTGYVAGEDAANSMG